MRVVLLALLTWIALGPPLRGGRPVGELELIGLATIPWGTRFEETPFGGLSGIAYDAQLDRFYAISDDPNFRHPSRFYTLKLDLAGDRLAPDGAAIEGVTMLTDRNGRQFAERVIDGEGIALTPGRTLLISSEGNVRHGVPPSIREFGLGGSEIREYRLPKRWLPKKRKPRGARHNLVFEAIALHPDGEHFSTATETALLQDGPSTDLDQSSPVRIARFRTRSGKHVADHVYVVEPVVDAPEPADAFRVNGLVELLALSDTSLLALERSFSMGVGNSIRLYLISTIGADDERRRKSLAGRRDISPVSKLLLLDLADLDLYVDNVEGMALGPRLEDGRRSLILVSDDNFSSDQTTQFFAFALGARETSPSTVQGADHRSSSEGDSLTDLRGVVTAADLEGRRGGFWIQDREGDSDDSTSDGVFIAAMDGGVSVEVGDLVSIDGRVVEQEWPGTLPITRIEAERVEVLARQVALPEPVEIGGGGRRVPAIVDDDGLDAFDPLGDAIDFYESLEGMRVRVGEATIVGPTTRFGTFTIAIDDGDGVRTSRGGLRQVAGDSNTERLTVDGSLIGGLPEVEVGRRLSEPLVGVLDYAFGNYRLVVTEPVRLAGHESPPAKQTFVIDADRLSVATYNVWNLDPGDSEERFAALGDQIASRRPDIVALQEIQDDSGTEDDGTVGAAATLGKLIEAISTHGGPSYEPLQIDPSNNADGGAPGGNIRVAFLYQPARVSVVTEDSRLGEANPTRLFESSEAFLHDPETGFEATRKPLAAEFDFGGHRFVAINVHLKSKRGDDGLFGSRQPPVRATEVQRSAQVRELGGYVAALLEDDPEALVMVLGDFNEMEFRPPMRLFADHGLTNLAERVDECERYTYIYEGNSGAIDHILASPSLAARTAQIEFAHLNADLPDSRRSSDHDAVLASFDLGSALE